MLNKDQLWKLSIVVFIFGGMSLAITYAWLLGCYPPPTHPCTSISSCPPQSLPVSCPDVIQYFLPVFTASFFVIAIIFLMISRNRRSEEHTSELQSRRDLVCRLLLEKKKKKKKLH